jgi:hypothetical protein
MSVVEVRASADRSRGKEPWQRERGAGGKFLPGPNAERPRRDHRSLQKRIADEVVEALGGSVEPHVMRLIKLYARLQARVEKADAADTKLTRMISNAARLRRQLGLDRPLKRIDRDTLHDARVYLKGDDE